MKKNCLSILVFIIIFLAICSCGSNYYVRKAEKLENLDQYNEATALYEHAFKKNKTNANAYLGLKRCGQKILDDKLDEFNFAYRNKDYKKTYYIYERAQKIYRKIKEAGVELDFPTYYQEYYRDAKSIFLEERYLEAENFLNAEKFSDAEQALKEVIKLEKDYKDANAKLIIAVYEPKYRKAVLLMEEEDYKNAYWEFNDINARVKYKESSELQAESLEKGSLRISVLAVENKSSASLNQYINSLRLKFISQLNNSNNPFLRVVDEDSKSQKKEKSLFYLKSEIISFHYDEGKLKQESKKGYLRETKRIKNKQSNEYELIKTYKKVEYNEFSRKSVLSMKVSYKLVQSQTNEIVFIDTKDIISTDLINYAHYEGNAENLFPGTWETSNKNSSSDRVYDDIQSKTNLTRLLKSRNKIKTKEVLLKEVFKEIESLIPTNIENAIYNI